MVWLRQFRDRLAGRRPGGDAGPATAPAASVSIDPATLMRLKSLELRARCVVEGFLSGIHRSPWHGFSVEFTDYRQYSPGDDIRYLDWRLFARQDRYYIKRFEDETNLRCYLVADFSRSMEYGTTGYTKADYARTALATLAWFLSRQHDAAGLVTFDEAVGEYLPARYRPGHLRRLMVALERATSGKRTQIAPSLEQIARLTPRRGMVVLVSDLLAPLDDLGRNLGFLRSRGHDILVVRVLDPREVDLDLSDSSIFQDLESGREMFVDPEAIRRDYRKRFAAHAAEIEQICRGQTARLLTVTTDQPLDRVLAELIQQQRRLAGRARRRPARAFGGNGAGA
jgi:uncharacterized protein (DUF58 family)